MVKVMVVGVRGRQEVEDMMYEEHYYKLIQRKDGAISKRKS